ncbi:MAG: hypothetical protein JRF64_04055 [Deltaproteobacteria bacterium]|nr:hypothetical protein [Deltaproteobacteria bacterium]
MSKAAQARPPRLSARNGGQGFSSRRTGGTPQTQTRGERRSSEKEPFVDGNQLTLKGGGAGKDITGGKATLVIIL